MKISLAQINTIAGDVKGNLKKVIFYLGKAEKQGSDLAIFPESCLTGYPSYDLWLNKELIKENLKALKTIAKKTTHIACLIGYIDFNKTSVGKPLLNSAALIYKGKIFASRIKTLLPTYDVFDEHRYFQPSQENKVINFKGTRIGITICEDIWSEHLTSPHKLYTKNPVEDLFLQKPDLIFNLSASPYNLNKPNFRYKLVKTLAKKYAMGFIYCNSVGGNDELIFDGNSMVFDKYGNLIAKAKSFEEDLITVDISAENKPVKWEKDKPAKELSDALTLGVKDFLHKSGFETAVLGLSGGIDSAVTATILAKSLGSKNVTAVFMPSQYTSKISTVDAQKLAKNLGIKLYVLPITGLMENYSALLKPIFKNKSPGVAKENLQARIRANLLMALSNKFGQMLIATGNKSELATGYSTLYGDMCGGVAVLSDLTKNQIYSLANYFNEKKEIIPKRTITRPPSAELKHNQKDQDSLPPYDVLDEIIKLYIEQSKPVSEIIKKGFSKKVVLETVKRIDKAEFKRRQSPPVLKVSPKAFGTGRRIPLSCKYY
ncbi:MAG TPA: NAD+ synthase [Elusimicrobiales bacterium]|nr:NAD+ synthase [Elusimicrobiales bacterium]